MRCVFSSPRLENVEAVAKLLEDAGIEVKVSNDRSYKGTRRQAFSYRETAAAESNPQVWVIKAEDQPKARAMLREQGLIDDAKRGFGGAGSASALSYLPASATAPATRKPDRRASLVMRVRVALLLIIVTLALLIVSGVFRH